MKKTSIFWMVMGAVVAGGVAASIFSVPKASSREVAMPALGPTLGLRTVEGAITEVQMAAALPVVKVSPADGEPLELAIDPISTVVLQDKRTTSVAQLEKGQKVKVSYQTKEGRVVANAIEILDPLPMPAATDGPPAASVPGS